MKWFRFKWLRFKREHIKEHDGLTTIIQLVPMLIVLSFLAAAVGRIFKRTFKQRLNVLYLWLKSPKGEYYPLPYQQAMRIARKREWDFADVEPKLNRWQALKRIIGVKVW